MRRGGWHSDIRRGEPLEIDPADQRFWIFVELKKPPESPIYHIAPDSWVRNNIYKTHQEVLRRRGGARLNNPKSTHHAIRRARIAEWRDRWDLPGIL